MVDSNTLGNNILIDEFKADHTSFRQKFIEDDDEPMESTEIDDHFNIAECNKMDMSIIKEVSLNESLTSV